MIWQSALLSAGPFKTFSIPLLPALSTRGFHTFFLPILDVIACASHGVLSGPAVERIEKSVLKEVYFLDTVPPKAGVACDKIKYLSVAHMFAEAIERIYEEVSVSKLFV